MPGNGIWSPCGSADPVPLALAAGSLSHALKAADSPPAELAAPQPDGCLLLRVQVLAVALGPNASLIFDWLAAQRRSSPSRSSNSSAWPLAPRALFATRDGSDMTAGAGHAHIHHVPRSSKDHHGTGLLPELGAGTHESIRYIGGMRFDSSDPETAEEADTEWCTFGESLWVLPRVELSAGAATSTAEVAAASSDISSCAGWSVAGCGTFDATQCLVRVTLAVHLRWNPSCGAESWAAERSRALEALSCLRAPGTGLTPTPSVVARRSEMASEDEFADQIGKALWAFQTGQMQKVVLARRVDLDLVDPADPVEILTQVVGHGQKRSYLFLLEPEAGTAFMSVTPERLCKIRDRDVWTEAVAGTWPLAEFERIGEAELMASSEKHSSEHRLVVDYICERLRPRSETLKVCEKHILKLKHLVHLKQSYHAIAKYADETADAVPNGIGPHDPSTTTPHELTSWFCQYVSPTPAVGGLPLQEARRFLRTAEKFDRGFYAAPCGAVGANGAELIVAIRSALLSGGKRLHVYAGAGIVPGSTAAEEFAEMTLKMKQFTDAFPTAPTAELLPSGRLEKYLSAPNMNTLWAALFVEECVRNGMKYFVICPGSRSTPLVVAVSRHPHARYVMNHDERGAAYYALGWAKAVGAPVGVIVTSGTAVANLLPGCVEANVASVPLLLITADRPHELKDTGANQTITQPGIFGVNVRWSKEFPPPSVEYPAHAFLGDVDLALAHAAGKLTKNPGPVHLNFCFRENLAPEGGPVRGDPARTSDWDASYIDTPSMSRWIDCNQPRSTFAQPSLSLAPVDVVQELVQMVESGSSRIVVIAGALRTAEEALVAEDIALRLHAATFADITSGLRQRPCTVGYADQLLNSPFLAGDVLQIDAIVHVGGPVCSARLQAFAKAARASLHVRVAPAPVRLDPDFTVTHHLPCSLQAFADALITAGCKRADGPPGFWRYLSAAAGEELETLMASRDALTEPLVAHLVSRLLPLGARLLISSSMPIRDLDFFARPYVDMTAAAQAPCQPPLANRGASGIDGVISTAAGFCKGSGSNATLVIGDTATLHDLNALQQLAGETAPPLTIVIVNNSGGGIFSFLPIAKHKQVFSPFFDAPHEVDFSAACEAFGIPHVLCDTVEAFEAAYTHSQKANRASGAIVLEARVALSHEENVSLHKELNQAVATRVQRELIRHVNLNWSYHPGTTKEQPLDLAPMLLLHGWLGEKRDWAPASRQLVEAGRSVLLADLPGHGGTVVSAFGSDDGAGAQMGHWEAAALFSMPFVVALLVDLLDRLHISQAVAVGYSLGGRVAMSMASQQASRVVGTVAISANPGLQKNADKQSRWREDCGLAARLSAMADELPVEQGSADGSFDRFLEGWYAAPLWAGFAQRRREAYASMLRRRRLTCPRLAAHALRGMSVARQPNLWPKCGGGAVGSSPPLRYVCGALDTKFAHIGRDLQTCASAGDSSAPITVVELPGAAHALLEELPEQVATAVMDTEWLRPCRSGFEPPPRTEWGSDGQTQDAQSLVLSAAWAHPLQLSLTAPLALSRGDPMTRRSGLLLVLEASGTDGSGYAGLGEVSPLPLFHKETLQEAEAQLRAVCALWTSQPPAVPLSLARLDGGMQPWLDANCGGQPLLPSVKAGIEMALLHLLGRVSKAPHLGIAAAAARGLCCASEVGINALVAREEDLGGPQGADVVKVKVGKDPVDDAKRANSIAALMREQKGVNARVRLDANQAWTIDQAAEFMSALSEDAAAVIEYIEEPVQGNCPESYLRSWEEIAVRTSRCLPLAVDESLTEAAVSTEQLATCQAPIAALILKPSLQGLERTLELSGWASRHSARPVLSSAFESGVALCHFAILASATTPPQWEAATQGHSNGCSDVREVSDCHGLGTFTRLAEDVLRPPFAELVACSSRSAGSGWRVDPLLCQDALDRTVDALVDEKKRHAGA